MLRSRDRSAGVVGALRAVGTTPVLCPLIAHELPEDTSLLGEGLRRLALGEFAWVVFTSVTTVRALLQVRAQAGADRPHAARLDVAPTTKVAAVGNATADALRSVGVNVDLIPAAEHSALGLLGEWPRLEDTARADVFLPAADIASPLLRDSLLERGWRVVDVAAYHTVSAPGRAERLVNHELSGNEAAAAGGSVEEIDAASLADELAAGTLDAALLTSPSTARRVHEVLGGRPSLTGFVAIGPRTATEADALGLRVDAVAVTTDPVGLADALAARRGAATETVQRTETK